MCAIEAEVGCLVTVDEEDAIDGEEVEEVVGSEGIKDEVDDDIDDDY